MTTNFQNLSGQKYLDDVLPVLARSKKALAGLKREIGPDDMKAAVAMMLKAELVGTLGVIIHDYFYETIADQAKQAWGGERGCPALC